VLERRRRVLEHAHRLLQQSELARALGKQAGGPQGHAERSGHVGRARQRELLRGEQVCTVGVARGRQRQRGIGAPEHRDRREGAHVQAFAVQQILDALLPPSHGDPRSPPADQGPAVHQQLGHRAAKTGLLEEGRRLIRPAALEQALGDGRHRQRQHRPPTRLQLGVHRREPVGFGVTHVAAQPADEPA
jgi:hypothetical protein